VPRKEAVSDTWDRPMRKIAVKKTAVLNSVFCSFCSKRNTEQAEAAEM